MPVTHAVLIATADPARHVLHLVGAVLAAGGAIFLFVSLAITGAARAQRRRGIQTTGTITGYGIPPRAGRLRDAGGPDYPIVEFATLEGRLVHGLAQNGSSPRPGRVGEPITVYYTPEQPERFLAVTDRSRRVGGCVTGVISAVGVVLLLIGLGIVL